MPSQRPVNPVSATEVQGGTTAAPQERCIWKFQPTDTTKGPFVMEIGGSSFSGQWDTVFRLGYNVNDGGTKWVTTDSYSAFVIEQDYYQSGTTHLVETYFEARPNAQQDGSSNQLSLRPFNFTILKTATTFETLFNDLSLTGPLKVYLPDTSVATTFSRMRVDFSDFNNLNIYGKASNKLNLKAVAGGLSQINLGYDTTESVAVIETEASTQFKISPGSLQGLQFYKINSAAATALCLNGNDNGAAFTVCVGSGFAANPALVARAHASQSGSIFEIQTSGSTVLSRFNKDGYFMTRKTSAPADGDVSTSECALWFDNTNGAGKLMVKGKTANGTVVTGSVTLA